MLDIFISDNGNTGEGGQLTARPQMDILVRSIDDAPHFTATSNTFEMLEDGVLKLTGVQVHDPDNETGAFQLNASAMFGIVRLSPDFDLRNSDVAASIEAEGRLLQIRASLSSLKTILDNLEYVPDLNYNHYAGSFDVVTMTIRDTTFLSGEDLLLDIMIDPVNDPPSITQVHKDVIIGYEDEVIDIGVTSVLDPDCSSDDGMITVWLHADSGAFIFNEMRGLWILDAKKDLYEEVVQGLLDHVNDALGNLSYVGSNNFAGNDTVRIDVSDEGHRGAGNVLNASASDCTFKYFPLTMLLKLPSASLKIIAF